MAAELGFKQQQNQCRHKQQDCRIANGQQIQCKDREEHHQGAQSAGNYGSRRVEFEIDEQCSANQKQERNIWVDEPAQQFVAHGGTHHINARAGQVECLFGPVQASNLAAVE